MRCHRLVLLPLSGMLACTGGSSGDRVDASITDASDPPVIDGAGTVLDGAPEPDGAPSTDAAVDAGAADAALDAPTDAAIDAPTDAATPTCGMAPTGNWRGTVRMQENASGGLTYVEADLVWMLVATTGCTDTFRPTGTVRYGFDMSGGSGESQILAAPGDGTLVVDRTSAVASYTIAGSTAPAGEWADHQGTFDGRVIGGYLPDQGGSIARRWNLVRVDAEFVPPGAACAEPATETWRSSINNVDDQSRAEVTWTRVATSGCEDTFAPSGTAYHGPWSTPNATGTFEPDHGAIEAGDGELRIDRSTAPPTFYLQRGFSSWPAQLVYTYPDGRVEREDGWGGSTWAVIAIGPYDGDHFSARIADGTTWSFSRD